MCIHTVYVFVCICLCTCIFIYVYAYVYVYVCEYVRVYVYVYVSYICICLCLVTLATNMNVFHICLDFNVCLTFPGTSFSRLCVGVVVTLADCHHAGPNDFRSFCFFSLLTWSEDEG